MNLKFISICCKRIFIIFSLIVSILAIVKLPSIGPTCAFIRQISHPYLLFHFENHQNESPYLQNQFLPLHYKNHTIALDLHKFLDC